MVYFGKFIKDCQYEVYDRELINTSYIRFKYFNKVNIYRRKWYQMSPTGVIIGIEVDQCYCNKFNREFYYLYPKIYRYEEIPI